MQASVDDKVMPSAQYIEVPVLVELRATLISDRDFEQFTCHHQVMRVSLMPVPCVHCPLRS
jgi:hypothetical protein